MVDVSFALLNAINEPVNANPAMIDTGMSLIDAGCEMMITELAGVNAKHRLVNASPFTASADVPLFIVSGGFVSACPQKMTDRL